MLCCSTSDVTRCFVISRVYGWLAKAAFRREILPRIISPKLKRDLVSNGPVFCEFSRTDLATAFPALAAVFQEKLRRLLLRQKLARLVVPRRACHATRTFRI